eukprot:365208-Chlamydomonas_euryale.AAC.11
MGGRGEEGRVLGRGPPDKPALVQGQAQTAFARHGSQRSALSSKPAGIRLRRQRAKGNKALVKRAFVRGQGKQGFDQTGLCITKGNKALAERPLCGEQGFGQPALV